MYEIQEKIQIMFFMQIAWNMFIQLYFRELRPK